MLQRKGKDLLEKESVNIGHIDQRRELAQLYIYLCDFGEKGERGEGGRAGEGSGSVNSSSYSSESMCKWRREQAEDSQRLLGFGGEAQSTIQLQTFPVPTAQAGSCGKGRLVLVP